MHCSKLAASEKAQIKSQSNGGLIDDSPSTSKQKCMLISSSIRNGVGGMLAHGESLLLERKEKKKKKLKGKMNIWKLQQRKGNAEVLF